MDCKILQGLMKTAIRDSLIGLTSTNQEIALFDFGNVVVQRDYFGQECVKIVSGGTFLFGHFVGKGMLTAAIQGESFKAPQPPVILRALRELSLNSVFGVLIIVPANSDILLNFGLAIERALNDNIRVKLLAVDDNFHEDIPKIRRKALCGVVLVNKIAGALSARQKSLQEIYAYCEIVMKNIISYEIDLTDYREQMDRRCSCGTDQYLIEKHPPKRRLTVVDIGDDVCQAVIDNIFSTSSLPDELANNTKVNLKAEDNVVVLFNNCGAVNDTEEYIFVKGFVKLLQNQGLVVQRFYSGQFLKCSRDTNLSITLLKIFDADVLHYITDPCSAPGWREVNQTFFPISLENIMGGNLRRKDRLTPPIRGAKLNNRMANVLLLCAQFACDALISCEKQLNLIDSERGDGDTGTRLKIACEVLLKRMKLDKVITNYPFTFFEGLSKLLEVTVGGTMGCIYSTLFEAAANCFGEYSVEDQITPVVWLKALENVSGSLQRYGNVEYGDGTMFDPIYICAKVTRQGLDIGQNYIEAFGNGVSAAETSAQRTKQAKQKYPDAGAHAVGIWMRAVYEGVKLRLPLD